MNAPHVRFVTSVVGRLLMELRDELGRSTGRRTAAATAAPSAPAPAGDVDEDDRQAMPAKGIGKSRRPAR